MIRVLHVIVVVLAAIPWAIGCIGFGVALLLVLLADRIWPEATSGNCWSYVGPRWAKRGGYILIRAAEDVRVFGIGIVPHAIWVRELADSNGLEQTVPMRRTDARWLPWRTLYFPFRVRTTERPRSAKELP